MNRRRKAKGPKLDSSSSRTSSALLIAEGAKRRLTGDLAGAAEVLGRATELYPLVDTAWAELGEVMVAAGKPSQALEYLNRAVELSKPTGQRLFSLAWAHMKKEQYGRAREYLSGAVQLQPTLKDNAKLLSAEISFQERDWEQAAAEAAEVLKIAPEQRHALRIHTAACERLARLPESVQSARRLLALEPNLELHQWYLFKLNYLAETTPESLFEESCHWNRLYAAPLADGIRPHRNVADAGRRLKIGYFSPDLYHHAIFKMVAPVFEHHDASEFEVFVYSIGGRRDSFTADLERHTRNFIVLPSSREEIVERVRADEIDILVDLAGHSMLDPDSYLALALKPAPIQVSWLGVPSTTGMTTVDYFLGGPIFPYPDTDHLFSEKVYRLPRVSACYRPIATVPVAERPWLKNQYITFGSFNSPLKITREAVKVWSLILHLVPESRLLFKSKDLDRPFLNERLRAWLSEDGIATERVQFEGISEPREYMYSWGNVDIALDPFPYNGGTTTLDALWAGVPVVVLHGRPPAHTNSSSLLQAAGLPFAETPEQYVSLAVFLANNTPKEPGIRQRVHQAIASSALMDEVGLVRAVEAAYREMWRVWCENRG